MDPSWSYVAGQGVLADARLSQYQGRRALVTGGLGFIGSNVARALVALGCEVRVVDSMRDGQGGNLFNLEDLKSEIDIRVADVRDQDMVNEAVQGCDFVFHIAGTGSHLDSLEDPFNDMELNVKGSLCVLEAVRHHAPEAHLVYAGTRSEYGLIQTRPVSETHPLLPTEANSVHKAAASLYQIAYHQAYGLHTCSLRLPNVYGPRMLTRHHRIGFINWFVKLAVDGGTFRLYGDGGQVRDMLYVDDLVLAFLLAAVTPQAAGDVFNVGSGEPSSLAAITQELVRIAGRGKVEFVPFPEEAKRIEIGDYVADIEKIRDCLGWRPQVSLCDGLERTVRYYEAYKEHYV
ncbi:MAG TPA: SDR family NAD(P)-dependent oxidoreductase [Dehalococcoidia bacterium]|nr:SDR family NAD(P)-dependent oxidoreductase [Dehalococcoidia bacterium]